MWDAHERSQQGSVPNSNWTPCFNGLKGKEPPACKVSWFWRHLHGLKQVLFLKATHTKKKCDLSHHVFAQAARHPSKLLSVRLPATLRRRRYCKINGFPISCRNIGMKKGHTLHHRSSAKGAIPWSDTWLVPLPGFQFWPFNLNLQPENPQRKCSDSSGPRWLCEV